FFFFFFSSRRRHTRSLRDWSSDVCSSDLAARREKQEVRIFAPRGLDLCEVFWGRRRCARIAVIGDSERVATVPDRQRDQFRQRRSEERRVGKECRSRRATDT